MSTHNIRFHWEIRKIFVLLLLLSGALIICFCPYFWEYIISLRETGTDQYSKGPLSFISATWCLYSFPKNVSSSAIFFDILFTLSIQTDRHTGLSKQRRTRSGSTLFSTYPAVLVTSAGINPL